MRALAIAIALLALGCAATPGRVVSAKDAARKATYVALSGARVKPKANNKKAGGGWYLVASGVLERPEVARLGVRVASRGRGARLADCRDLSFLANGRPLALSAVDYSAQGRGRFERLSAEVPLAELRALAEARDARGRACLGQFALSAEQQASLKELVDRLSAAPPAAATAPASAPATQQ
jgi:hypothetical protein